MSDEKECTIAYCGNEGQLLLVCQNDHYMHLICLFEWNKRQQTCPMCREPTLPEARLALEKEYERILDSPRLLSVEDLDTTQIMFRSPRVLSIFGTSISVYYRSQRCLILETPRMRAPFGISATPFGTDRLSINFGLKSDNPRHQLFYAKIRELEEVVQRHVNSMDEYRDYEQISVIKDVDNFPSIFYTRLYTTSAGRIFTNFFVDFNGVPCKVEFSKESFPKRSKGRALLHLGPIWISNQTMKFGLLFKVHEMIVYPPRNVIDAITV